MHRRSGRSTAWPFDSSPETFEFLRGGFGLLLPPNDRPNEGQSLTRFGESVEEPLQRLDARAA
jgi:hypothetical protein